MILWFLVGVLSALLTFYFDKESYYPYQDDLFRQFYVLLSIVCGGLLSLLYVLVCFYLTRDNK
jgi:hypothetical protein|tara:strand:- start:23736 stop:23924 length:189 start_codon:yes stop_codon:yes gene_type:complete